MSVQAGDEDVAERHVVQELQPRHHHPGHPEEDDVEAGHEHARRVEDLEVARLLRPAERREGPERRREPCVEHVLVLPERPAPAGRAGRRVLARHGRVAVLAVPGRDAVAPPELARDAPRLDVLHPVGVDLRPPLGHEARPAVAHGLERRVGHALYFEEPLLGHERLDDPLAAVAVRHLVAVLLHLADQAELLERGHDLLARLEAVEAGEAARVRCHLAVEADHDHLRESVPHPDLEVRRVVRGRHLYRARAELLLHGLVRDHGDLAVHEREDERLAHQVRVALVVRVHGHGCVAEHGLGPRRRHGHELAAGRPTGSILDRVADLGERPLHLFLGRFEVGERAVLDAPVHHPRAPVDEPLFVERHEHLAHGMREPLVEREALARPVHRRALAPDLPLDGAARVRAPLPDAPLELFAPEPLAREALGLELSLDHDLRRDARVVGAGQPERLEALHPLPPRKDVHQRVLEGVAHVEVAGYVRRRDHDRIHGRVRVRVRRVVAARFPLPVPALLGALRVVRGRKFGAAHGRLSVVSCRLSASDSK
jgi:hypothetical protein